MYWLPGILELLSTAGLAPFPRTKLYERPSPLLLRWLSASPAAGNEAWTQGLLKCQQHQNHLARGKPDCQAPPRVSVVSEIWAPENMHLLQVLNDMTMVLGHSPHFKDHSFEDSILPLSPDS